MKLGKLERDYPLFLAPMAGYTDRAMRLICKKHGADFVESKLVFEPEWTKDMMSEEAKLELGFL